MKKALLSELEYDFDRYVYLQKETGSIVFETIFEREHSYLDKDLFHSCIEDNVLYDDSYGEEYINRCSVIKEYLQRASNKHKPILD